MEKKINKRAVGIIITLVAGVCWGFSGAGGQFLFMYKEATSNWLVPIRLFSAGLIMLIYLFIQERNKIFAPWKNWRDAKDLLIFTVFGMTLCQYSYFTTIQYSNAGVATVLQYTGPAMILVYVCLRQKKLPTITEVIAVILSIGGTFLLATHGDITSFALSKEALIWGAIAALTLVIYTLQPSRLIDNYGSGIVLGWSMFLGGIVMLSIFKPWEAKEVIIDWQCIAIAAMVIVIGTIVSFNLYLKGVQLIGPAKASLIACIEPVAAIIFSAAWLGVQFMPMDLVGMTCTITAVVLLSLFKEKE